MKEDKLNNNWQVEKKIRIKKDLGCGFCPPNKVENSDGDNQFHNKHKSWKFKTKKKHQHD